MIVFSYSREHHKMKTYSVGDKVVHPMHGAGIVEEIKEIDFGGKKKKYYEVRLRLAIWLPIFLWKMRSV